MGSMAQITLVVLCCILSPFFKHCPFHLRNLKTDWRTTVLNSAEEDNNFPWSAGHTFNVDHYAVCLICNENTSVAHFQLGSNHNIPLLSHRCSVQPVVSQPVLLHGVNLHRHRTSHLFSLNFMRFPLTQSSGFSKSSWIEFLPFGVLNSLSCQFKVIYDFSQGAFCLTI